MLILCSCENNDGINAVICAHRGYHYIEKENSLNSFVKAVKNKCSWAELDVWCTKDNQLVVTHDKNLSGVYNKDVDVTQVSLEELRSYVTKSQVPTLDDVWNSVKGKIKLQIEIKDENAVPLVLDFFKENNCYDDCVVISFIADCLIDIKKADSNIICGYLADSFFYWMPSIKWADVLAIKYTGITEDDIKSAHIAGKSVYVWTVDSLLDIRKMDSWGVDVITTNNPSLLES